MRAGVYRRPHKNLNNTYVYFNVIVVLFIIIVHRL